MKKAPPSYTQFFIFTFLFSYVYSQSQDSCTSPLTLQSPLFFDTASLQCVTVWDSQGFILRYVQAAPAVWNFVLSAPNTNAYVGIGFSPNGDMVGSTALVGWVEGSGTSNMKEYFLGGQQSNLVRVTQPPNGLPIGNSTMLVQSNQIYIAFQLRTTQPSSRLIYAVGPVGRLPPQSPDYALTEHQEKISTSLNYASGQFQTEKRPESSLRKSHGLLNMLGWAILMPIGAMVARYMRKWDPLWFYLHAAIQSTGFILGLIGVICGLVLDSRLSANVSKHKALGIFIFTFGSLQVLALLIRPDKTSKIRKYWNWYHFGVGRVLIFLAAVNVFYGIHLGKPGSSWNAGFAAVLVILFIITLIMEIRIWFKK